MGALPLPGRLGLQSVEEAQRLGQRCGPAGGLGAGGAALGLLRGQALQLPADLVGQRDEGHSWLAAARRDAWGQVQRVAAGRVGVL